MGWKNVKEHYRIEHMVFLNEGDVCIGSGYVPDIIRISPSLNFTIKMPPLSGILARYREEMEADLDTLRRLIEEPDTFTASIPVYTYEGGEILEKRCEELGWPNITHDGLIQYENTFSADRDEVVATAKRRAAYAMESVRDSIAEEERRLAELRDRLATYEADKAKLNADFPDIPAAA